MCGGTTKVYCEKMFALLLGACTEGNRVEVIDNLDLYFEYMIFAFFIHRLT